MGSGFGAPPSVAEQFPLKVIIGREDVTPYVAEGMTFSNVDPGGYEMSSFQIPKDLPTTLRGMYIRIDSGLHTAWEGRISEVQRSLGNETTITGEGYGALFKDNTMAQIFVDQDLTQWASATVERQIVDLSNGYGLSAAQVAASLSGSPALALIQSGAWTAGATALIEAWYDSQGIPIQEIYFNAIFLAGSSAAGFVANVLLSTDDVGTTTDAFGNFNTSQAADVVATVGNRLFAQLVCTTTNAAGGAANGQYGVYIGPVAVYGNHGITQRGPSPSGFYASDIAAYVAAQTPGLQAGNIQQANGYIIPQSVYLTPVTTDQIIADMSVAAGWHWGVWESLSPLTGNPTPRFDFRPRPGQGGFTAFCMRADCDTVDVKEDLSGQYNQANVSYTDVAGVSRQVTVQLDNPILDAAGIPSRTIQFNGGLMTHATAQLFGLEALALLYEQDRVSGSIACSGTIDGAFGPMPSWMLKAGIDRLRIGDLPSTDAFGAYNDVPISRVETRAGADGISTTIEVGSGGNLVETLQSRLSAASVLAGQGGV